MNRLFGSPLAFARPSSTVCATFNSLAVAKSKRVGPILPCTSLSPLPLPRAPPAPVPSFKRLATTAAAAVPETNATVVEPLPGTPTSSLVIGVPKETFKGEKRVAISPTNVTQLVKKGFQVTVASGAGAESKFSDLDYIEAGATIVEQKAAFGADIVLKVRAPEPNGPNRTLHEVDLMKRGAALYSFIRPAQNEDLVERLRVAGVSAIGMDCVPRISRAQVFDALSSMANISGYKAVIEAANNFGRFFTGQITAAGKVPPAKVLVIGAGVAGLSAIGAAKSMGAVVRGFDTRPAAAEQVLSMGAEFITVEIEEDGTGVGGYAKEMSKEFIEAEMALFAKQAAEVDIVITTALIPGRAAPRLWLKEHVNAMKPGSVIVDLAAEAGGNCEVTKPGDTYKYKDVTIIGRTDFPSSLPTQSSTLYGNNVTKLVLSMVNKEDKFYLDHDDDVTRGSLVTQDEKLMWPPPPLDPAAFGAAPKKAVPKEEKEVAPPNPFGDRVKQVASYSVGMASMFAIGLNSPPEFVMSLTTFALAFICGYQVVWGVTPALHSPLMSVTNAISGIVAVGGMVLMGGGLLPQTTPQILAATAAFIASINIGGGFLVTKRMLDMFKRPNDLPEYHGLWALPGLGFIAAYGALVSQGGPATLSATAYLLASVLCISAISGLSAQSTARWGNAMGILGVSIGLAATLGSNGYSPETIIQIASVMGLGGLVGLGIGQRVAVTSLPQTVAAFHAFVGLAAVLVCYASEIHHHSLDLVSHTSLDTIHALSVYFGTVIGAITFTGSLVAFGKLDGRLNSKALALPGKNLYNLAMGTSLLGMGQLFVAAPSLAASMPYLMACTAVSMAFGWHMTASVGGADMPIIITILNSSAGWAIATEGFMLNNSLLTITGALIGSSGAILSYIMCVAMNRKILSVLFGGFGNSKAIGTGEAMEVTGEVTETSSDEVADWLVGAKNVVIVPGYGLAVAKAQYAIADIVAQLTKAGSKVRFGIRTLFTLALPHLPSIHEGHPQIPLLAGCRDSLMCCWLRQECLTMW
eukprot:TRINITY_DN663_c0_g1_i1.p1 TRINITY_DN663_c0_g1~~TRINITY_DN663_c0_g1_i1.p1  ORF type:complete len:1033 (+),score=198.48 TRINITY_DN663_c0_g1_i1:351-3449(+)